MKKNTENSATINQSLTDSNIWDALPSLIQGCGAYTLEEQAELLHLLKEQENDDETIEYQDVAFVTTDNPESLLMAKEETQVFVEAKVEDVFEEKKEDKKDDTLIYNDETGELKDFTATKPQFVRMSLKELAKAKNELREVLKVEKWVVNNVLKDIKEFTSKAVEEQAAATGVDPVILARVLKSEALKKRGLARVFITRS